MARAIKNNTTLPIFNVLHSSSHVRLLPSEYQRQRRDACAPAFAAGCWPHLLACLLLTCLLLTVP